VDPEAGHRPVQITVTFASATPTGGELAILIDQQQVASTPLAGGETTVTTQIAFDPNLPLGPVTLTARFGASEVSTTLVIAVPVAVQVASLTAEPNPVTGGETVTFTVTVAAPAPSNTTVSLEVEGQIVAVVPMAAGDTIGTLQIQTGAGQTATFTVTARSGESQASVDLTIQ
jgi:hypothetical protein